MTIWVDYTNHRGERAWRQIRETIGPSMLATYPPLAADYDGPRTTKLCIDVFMIDRAAKRTLALTSIHGFADVIEKPVETVEKIDQAPPLGQAVQALSQMTEVEVRELNTHVQTRLNVMGAANTGLKWSSFVEATHKHFFATDATSLDAYLRMIRRMAGLPDITREMMELPIVTQEKQSAASFGSIGRQLVDVRYQQIDDARTLARIVEILTEMRVYMSGFDQRVDIIREKLIEYGDTGTGRLDAVVSQLDALAKAITDIGRQTMQEPHDPDAYRSWSSVRGQPMQGIGDQIERAWGLRQLTFEQLRHQNEERQKLWDTGAITNLYRAIKLGGEVGELLNEVKKYERERLGIKGSRTTLTKLAHKLGDVVICADLLASALGVKLEEAVSEAFNEKSKQLDFPQRL